MRKNLLIIAVLTILFHSCTSYKSVISKISLETNSKYSSSFFDKALEAANIDFSSVDTIYVLEHFYDIIWNYDQGVIWTNKGDYYNFKLNTSRSQKKGSPYRYYTGIEIVSNHKESKFEKEKSLIEQWSVEEIKKLDQERQKLDDGSFIAVRIVRKKKSFSGEFLNFNDLRDY